MARSSSPARLVIALSVAAVLAVFLLYTSIAGGSTPSVEPSELRGHSGKVGVSGRVVEPVARDDRTVRFRLRDIDGTLSVPVRFTGTIPDQFRLGRDVHVEGELRNGVFVADRLVTKCPSKYSPSGQAAKG